jgi:hypothetical protein
VQSGKFTARICRKQKLLVLANGLFLIFTSSHIEEHDFYPLLGISKVENVG